MNALSHDYPSRLGVLLGAENDSVADEFEEIAARAFASRTVAITPPSALRDSLFANLESTRLTTSAIRPADDIARGRRRIARRERGHGPRRRLLAVPAAVAILVIGGTGVGLALRPSGDDAATTALAAVSSAPDAAHASATFAAGTATVQIVSSVSLGESVAVVRDAPPATAGKTYELWYYRNGQATSAGSFTPTGTKTIVQLSGRFRARDVVAATLESSPLPSQPTSPPIFELPA